jgi:hypothetical protein
MFTLIYIFFLKDQMITKSVILITGGTGMISAIVGMQG